MAMKKLQIALGALALLAASGPVAAQEDDAVATEVVDAMNKLFGAHPGFRANHAKGIVATGSFKASPQAAQLSKAALFEGAAIPVTVRFSDATGLPNVPDGAGDANPHGLSIKFHLPSGEETDIVINSLKFFPVATGVQFRDMLRALAESPPNAPKPTKFEQFAAAHPSIPRAFATVKTPASFAEEEYYGINAFVFVNKKGEKQAFRYVAAPEKIVHLDPAEAAKKAPNFLIEELPSRLAHGPVTFRLKAQLASPGEPTNDPSHPWRDDDKVVELGVLTIDKVVADSLDAQKKLLFLPGQLIDGIEQSDDPMVDIRDGAYAVSFSRRNP